MYYDQIAAGRVIRRMRTQKHMTQELLSGFAGIARSHLSMIENGTKQANVETLLDSGHGCNIYYAFLVKCQRFVSRFGKPMFTPMLVAERK